jgi:hypothetical protein
LRVRVPVAVDRPEHDRLDHEACRDRRIWDGSKQLPARTVLEILRQQP